MFNEALKKFGLAVNELNSSYYTEKGMEEFDKDGSIRELIKKAEDISNLIHDKKFNIEE